MGSYLPVKRELAAQCAIIILQRIRESITTILDLFFFYKFTTNRAKFFDKMGNYFSIKHIIFHTPRSLLIKEDQSCFKFKRGI